MEFKEFPKNFLWGASTSSHQVEGGTFNDWSEWEKENAQRLAHEAQKRPQWQKSKFPEMFNPQNYISGKACDHYHRFEEDFDIAKSLGQNAHRFSIEWSRIEPEEGKFDEKEIEHCAKVIAALKDRGIEPLVTLWHWTLPVWLAEKGGVENRHFENYFVRYALKVVSSIGEDVKFWITLNEPDVFAGQAYLKGIWPPQKKGPVSYLRALKNLIRAHKKAYLKIKKLNNLFQVGISKHNIYFELAQDTILNKILKKIADLWWNKYFLWRIRQEQDFIGLNYYFHNRINYGFNKNENKIISDLGWELYPQGIYNVLKDLKKYNKPIYITENGLADAADEKRTWFILETLKNVYQAINEGVDVKGYLHWSLMDNFEWDKGFWPRFGLVEVDYKTMERKIRSSALFYKNICEQNGIKI
jgi:beta-glucosidase